MFEQLQEALDQFQAQEEEIERLRTKLLEKNVEIDEQEQTIEKLREAAVRNSKTEAAASKAMALANINQKLIYQKEKSDIKIKALEQENRELKGGANPQKLKDANCRLKEKNSELRKGNDLLKKNQSQYRSEISVLKKDLADQIKLRSQMSMTHVYTEDHHELWLVPSKLGMCRGHAGKEYLLALLHLAPNGVGYLVTVQNGEIALDKSIKDKNLPSMPKKMYEHAESWLSKVEAQGYAVTDSDLLAIGGFGELDEEI